jgi:hypothetical protein
MIQNAPIVWDKRSLDIPRASHLQLLFHSLYRFLLKRHLPSLSNMTMTNRFNPTKPSLASGWSCNSPFNFVKYLVILLISSFSSNLPSLSQDDSRIDLPKFFQPIRISEISCLSPKACPSVLLQIPPIRERERGGGVVPLVALLDRSSRMEFDRGSGWIFLNEENRTERRTSPR